MSELERVLGEQFGRSAAGRRLRRSPGLGASDPADKANEGLSPGVTYAGGPQTQRTGAQGTKAQQILDRIGGLFSDVDRSKCPPWMTPECAELLSRLAEQTFRNFQLTARRPSHMDPPFKARFIDQYDLTGVAIPIGSHGSPGAWTPIVTYGNPGIGFRSVIKSIGQAVKDLTAWDYLGWRVVVNGSPVDGYQEFRGQLFDWFPNCCFVPQNLVGDEKIVIEARNYDPVTAWEALARVTGYRYPVRVETGDSIRSTLVD